MASDDNNYYAPPDAPLVSEAPPEAYIEGSLSPRFLRIAAICAALQLAIAALSVVIELNAADPEPPNWFVYWTLVPSVILACFALFAFRRLLRARFNHHRSDKVIYWLIGLNVATLIPTPFVPPTFDPNDWAPAHDL